MMYLSLQISDELQNKNCVTLSQDDWKIDLSLQNVNTYTKGRVNVWWTCNKVFSMVAICQENEL